MFKIEAANAKISWLLVPRLSQALKKLSPTIPIMQQDSLDSPMSGKDLHLKNSM